MITDMSFFSFSIPLVPFDTPPYILFPSSLSSLHLFSRQLYTLGPEGSVPTVPSIDYRYDLLFHDVAHVLYK